LAITGGAGDAFLQHRLGAVCSRPRQTPLCAFSLEMAQVVHKASVSRRSHYQGTCMATVTATLSARSGSDRRRRIEQPTLDLRISPACVAAALTAIVAALVVLNAVAQWMELSTSGGLREIALRFDLDRENTVPAWYASTTLFSAAVLLALITLVKKRRDGCYLWHWALLALVFVCMAIDESTSSHEILIVPLRRFFHAGGVFYFAWVIPAFFAVAIFALGYVKFLAHLVPRTRYLFLIAGAVYVGGALGVELIGGALAESHGFASLRYIAVMTLEEVMEMMGVVIFIYALLDYLRSELGGWQTSLVAGR
jgi:hypothetical protein